MRMCFALLACLAACGPSTPTRKTAASVAHEENLPPLPRSSLAAVILHRDELQLGDEQVHAMQELDEQLTEETEKIRSAAHPHRPDAGPGTGGKKGNGLTMGPGAGGGGGGGPPGRPRLARGKPTQKGIRSLQERIDDADTHAYLQAEEQILEPTQRDRAREIAEKYREDLYDRRAKQGPSGEDEE